MKRVFIILTVALLLVSLCACGEKEEKRQPQVNDNTSVQEDDSSKAPDFVVRDGDGKAFKLSDFAGKPVVLNFWASWCGPCREEMPYFEEAYGELGSEVQFLMINLDGNRGDAEEFLTETGYGFPVYYDVYGKACKAYEVLSIPATYFINSEGDIVSYAVGSLTKSALLDGIAEINK